MANGWLSPTGEFHPCLIGHHHEMAKKIIDGYQDTWRHDTWIQITPDMAFSEKCPTQSQIDWLMARRHYRQDAKKMMEIK